MANTIEHHLTIADMALQLQMSLEKTRQIVRVEPGVLCFGGKKKMYRIPQSVAERILRRSANPEKK